VLSRIKEVFEQSRFVTTEAIMHHLGKDEKEVVPIINKLASKDLIALHDDNGTTLYRWLPDDERDAMRKRKAKLKGLTNEEKLVYQEIEKAATLGIGTREVKYVTKLKTGVPKMLERLQKRDLIKWVRTIEAKNKKIWMLIDLEPSRDVQGGPWYEDGIFKQEIVDAIKKVCLKYLEEEREVTCEDMTMKVNRSNVFNGTLSKDDVEYILKALVLDQELEGYHKLVKTKVKREDGKRVEVRYVFHYRQRKGGLLESPLNDIPCTVCPVADKCAPGNAVNPAECKYFTQWMDM